MASSAPAVAPAGAARAPEEEAADAKAAEEAKAAADAKDCEEVFKRFDVDGSGVIDAKETLLALRDVGIEVDPKMAIKIMEGYDADGSGGLGIDEFQKFVAELRKYQAAHMPKPEPRIDDDITAIFEKFDANRSGSIDVKELKPALSELGCEVEGDAAASLIRSFDSDKSGGLQSSEFRKLVVELRAYQKEHPPGPKSDKPRIAALEKKVAASTYLPRFRSKKILASKGGDEGGSFAAFMEKKAAQDAEDAAKAKEAKKNRRKKKGKVEGQKDEMSSEEAEAFWSLFFTIAFTVLLALSEAFDIDVLIGFALMPFITFMKSMADKFDNQDLDPTVWAGRFGNFSSTFAQEHPAGFVTVDFGLFAIGVVYFLYEADIAKWRRDRMLAEANSNSGYNQLEDEGAGGFGGPGGFLSKVSSDPDELMAMRTVAREEIEEVDLLLELRKNAEADVLADLNSQRSRLEKQIATYNQFLSALETEKEEGVDLEEMARLEAEAEAKKKREGGCTETTKMAVAVIKNAISGIITVWLYMMDLISDYQVTMLFYNAEAYRFAFISACLLVGQFLVIWLRVLPYLKDTYGATSTFYLLMLYGGMPFGMFFLDFLMFLGPFGLLPIVPMPESIEPSMAFHSPSMAFH